MTNPKWCFQNARSQLLYLGGLVALIEFRHVLVLVFQNKMQIYTDLHGPNSKGNILKFFYHLYIKIFYFQINKAPETTVYGYRLIN